MAETGKDIEKAAELLRAGGLVAIPTETVYGLAANALDANAVMKIFEAKNRPFFDPLIIHTDSLEKVKGYVTAIPELALQLATKFWPGPLTLLLPKAAIVPDIVSSGLDTVAVRIPAHPLTLALLQGIDFPLAAPSANPFGYVSPTQAAHVAKQLGNKVNYILDGGECEIGLESTIIGFTDIEEPVVYRLGGLVLEEIEKLIGKVEMSINQSSNPKAPGQLKSHYATRKALLISDDVQQVLDAKKNKRIAVISFTAVYKLQQEGYLKVLSPAGNLKEAAHHLFAAMRQLDETDAELIVAEKFPDNFLGRAINDRLQRAAVIS